MNWRYSSELPNIFLSFTFPLRWRGEVKDALWCRHVRAIGWYQLRAPGGPWGDPPTELIRAARFIWTALQWIIEAHNLNLVQVTWRCDCQSEYLLLISSTKVSKRWNEKKAQKNGPNRAHWSLGLTSSSFWSGSYLLMIFHDGAARNKKRKTKIPCRRTSHKKEVDDYRHLMPITCFDLIPFCWGNIVAGRRPSAPKITADWMRPFSNCDVCLFELVPTIKTNKTVFSQHFLQAVNRPNF